MSDVRNPEGAIRLIINADDFGYFDQVCRGILEVAERGVVTATGIMANGPAFEHWLDKLKGLTHLSIGVHLNATLGWPLTREMREALTSTNGRFPSLASLVSSLLLGRLPVSSLLREWRAQVERCLQAGLELTFINSHEHVHMLPALYSRVRRLADEFGIANVRAPQSEWSPLASPGAWVRSGMLTVLRGFVSSSPADEPILIGLAPSGRLDMRYCSWRFPRLVRGATYELMCHPGWRDNAADSDPKLCAYHDWEGELRTLTSPEFAGLLRQNDICLASFEDLERQAGRVNFSNPKDASRE